MDKGDLIHEVTAERAERLDRFLHRHIGGSRHQVEKLIKSGLVRIGDRTVLKSGQKVVPGDRVVYTIQSAPMTQPPPVHFDVPILYEDDDLLVLNKPASIVVHPAESVQEATLVDWLKAKGVRLSTISGQERHGIVHRLDKPTSGAIVIAKNNQVHQALAHQLQERSMGRYYLALIDRPLKSSMLIDKPIGRHRNNRLKMAIVPEGRAAQTRFEPLLCDEKSQVALVGAKLFTGRTHQIRVHLSSIDRHIFGDSLYGFKSQKVKINRILLHAYILYLIHPKSGRPLYIKAPIMADMQQMMEHYFSKETLNEALDVCYFLHRFGDRCDRLRTAGDAASYWSEKGV